MDVRDFLRSIPPNSSLETVKGVMHETLLPLGIRYVAENPEKGSRVLLYSKRMQSNFTHPIQFKANGLIFDYKTMKIVSQPPYSFNGHISSLNLSQSNNKKRNDLKVNYNIYKVQDGSVITLYYYNNSWRINTTKGYDMGDTIWMNNLTYWDVFNDIIKDTDFNMDKLDKNKSYSFGIKHHKFHPFMENQTEPIKRIWFIHSVSLKTLYVSTREDELGIPAQELSPITNARELSQACQNAIIDYVKHGKICFGFILRARSGVFNDRRLPFSNILMESELMKMIRFIMYRPLRLTEDHAIEYSLLNAYLDFRYHNVCRQVFPQYTSEYDKFNTMINTVIDEMIKIRDSDDYKGDGPAYNLAVYFTSVIKNRHSIEVKDGIREILRGIITDSEFTDKFYYEYLHPEQEKPFNDTPNRFSSTRFKTRRTKPSSN